MRIALALVVSVAACKGDPARPAPAPASDTAERMAAQQRAIDRAQAQQAQETAAAQADTRAAQLDALEKEVDHLEKMIDQASKMLAAARTDEDRKKATMLLDASQKRMSQVRDDLGKLQRPAK